MFGVLAAIPVSTICSGEVGRGVGDQGLAQRGAERWHVPADSAQGRDGVASDQLLQIEHVASVEDGQVRGLSGHSAEVP